MKKAAAAPPPQTANGSGLQAIWNTHP
jgi:hypothetical protein